MRSRIGLRLTPIAGVPAPPTTTFVLYCVFWPPIGIESGWRRAKGQVAKAAQPVLPDVPAMLAVSAACRVESGKMLVVTESDPRRTAGTAAKKFLASPQ